MPDPILSPLDGSLIAECVLPHVSAFSRAFDARILLLRVLDKNQSLENTRLFDLMNWQINKTGAKMYLDKVRDRLIQTGLKVEASVMEGSIVDTVSEVTRKQGVKLIILSSHGRGGSSQWGMSSVTQKIIFSATASVLVIRAYNPPDCGIEGLRYEQIVVPLDGSRRSEIVLPMAILLARYHHSKIHIVHVVKPPEMPRQMPLTREESELSERIVSRNQEEAIRYLDQVVQHSPLDGVDVQTHLLTNENTATALHELIEQEHIDLLVMSAHGHSGNTHWPYGGLVNNFMLYSKTPLLIVQDLPPRKESPSGEMTPREHPEH
jgi:nucleotide-binding universal stress UspA family protein